MRSLRVRVPGYDRLRSKERGGLQAGKRISCLLREKPKAKGRHTLALACGRTVHTKPDMKKDLFGSHPFDSLQSIKQALNNNAVISFNGKT